METTPKDGMDVTGRWGIDELRWVIDGDDTSPERVLAESASLRDFPLPAKTERGHVRLRRGVKALAIRGREVLIVKERHDDGTTFWTLPGGGLEPGELPAAGLERELSEELGCRAQVGEERCRYWYVHRSSPHTISRYEVLSAIPSSRIRPDPAEGILEHRWVRPTDAPGATLPEVHSVLARMFDLP